MKFLAIITLLCAVQPALHAQSISYAAQDKLVKDVLDDITSEYSIFFSYSTASIPDTRVSIDVQNIPISEFLEKLLRPLSLGFQLVEDGFIVIKPANEIGVLLSLYVVDIKTLEPIEFALIRQLNSYRGTNTDLNGRFSFFSKTPSQSNLEISHLGYLPKTFSSLELYSSGRDSIFLEPNTTELEGIVVTEYLNTGIAIKEDGSTLSLRPQSIDALPGLSEPDALYSLQVLPGVSSFDESASGLSIRGGSNDQVSMYWDDIPMYHSGHYFGLISALIPSSINNVNVYRGSAPTQFSGTASGLLEMKGPAFLPSETSFEISNNLTHSSATAFIPIKKHSLLLSGRRSFNDFVQTTTYDSFRQKLFESSEISREGEFLDDEESINSQDLVFWDLNGKWIWQPTYKSHISVSAYSNKNKLDFRTVNQETSSADFQFHEVQSTGINANWENFWSSNFETKLSISHSYYDLEFKFLNQREILGINTNPEKLFFKMEDEDEDEEDEEDEEEEDEDDPFDGGFDSAEDSLSDRGTWTNQIKNTEIRLVNTYSTGPNRFIYGGQLNFLNVRYALKEDNLFEDDFREESSSSGMGYSAFGNYIYGYSQPFTLNSGLRFNYFNFVDVATIDPQLTVTYRPTYWLQLKASAGRSHQHIRTLKDFNSSISSRTEEIWFMADKEEFPLLRNDQVSAGFVIQKNDWLLDVEAYSKKLTGLISVNYNFGGRNDESQGEDTIKGLDVLLRKRVNNFRSWVSYSYIEAESYFPELDDPRYPSFRDQPHKIQLVNTLSIGAFDLSLGWTFKSGAPYSEPASEQLTLVVEQDDDEIETDEHYEIDWGETNSLRLPNYHRMDASIWYQVPRTTNRKFTAKLGLSILNIYGRENILNRLFYPDDINSDEEIEIVEEEKFLLGFTPNLSIKLLF